MDQAFTFAVLLVIMLSEVSFQRSAKVVVGAMTLMSAEHADSVRVLWFFAAILQAVGVVGVENSPAAFALHSIGWGIDRLPW